MSKIRGFDMTDTRETFIQGANAFRNLRDLAKQHRDSFIQAANTRASQPGTAAAQPFDATIDLQHEDDSTCDEFVDRTEYVAPRDTRDANADATTTDDNEALSPSHHLYADDGSQDLSQASIAPGIDGPSMSSMTSFTSSHSSYQTRSKRQRSPR